MGNIWAIYALFISMLFIIAVLFSFYLFIVKPNGLKRAFNLSKEKYDEFTPTIKFLLVIVVLLILIGFWMPFLLTRDALIAEFDFTGTGAIGDTFGGILNPFVALAAVIVTGLAFYVQYQANQQARDQFKEGLKRQRELFDEEKRLESESWLQQKDTEERKSAIESFEAQFYELLRLHKENVNELSVEMDRKSVSSGASVRVRRVFVFFRVELTKAYELIDKIYKYKYPEHTDVFDLSLFRLTYYFFFEGLFISYHIPDETIAQKFGLRTDFIIFLKGVLANFTQQYPNNKQDKQHVCDLEGKLITVTTFGFQPFVGQSTRIGHYFRHLYFMVKFVADRKSELYDYSLKRYFLRILRIQLCNDEQVILFYNWLSGYGEKWEQSNLSLRKKRSGKYYFTDYRMIHNLNQDYLINGVDLDKIFG